jgi:hypothetical protein
MPTAPDSHAPFTICALEPMRNLPSPVLIGFVLTSGKSI